MMYILEKTAFYKDGVTDTSYFKRVSWPFIELCDRHEEAMQFSRRDDAEKMASRLSDYWRVVKAPKGVKR